MIAFGIFGALVVGFVAGFIVNIRTQAKQAVADRFQSAGLNRDAAKRYREAAKILHDLVYAADLEELVPILPTPMQKRIEDWLTQHKEAINNGK